MKNKYIVEYIEKDGLISIGIYKTYRAIAKATDEDYTDVRTIHLMCTGVIKKKFLHPRLKKLKTIMKINNLKF